MTFTAKLLSSIAQRATQFAYSLLAGIALFALTSCSSGWGAGNSTPPPLKPFSLQWDRNSEPEVISYNIYTKDLATGQYSYYATVAQPASGGVTYQLPAGVESGSTFAVTASTGALESPRSNDAAVPASPFAPKNLKIAPAP